MAIVEYHEGVNVTRYNNIAEELRKTYIAKNADYGNSFDDTLDTFGPIAAVVRISDKFSRMRSLTKRGALVGESLRDTVMDMANYAIMFAMWLEKQEASDESVD